MEHSTDGLPTPHRYWAIAAVGLSISLAVMDGAIANLALPAIAVDLRSSPEASIWVINSYQIAIIISMLAFASLGEFIGYRRVYQSGLVVFSITSLLCAVSSSLSELIFSRAAQGFGAAGIMCVNTALVRIIYPKEKLAKGMAINALVVALAAAIAPSVAALILAVSPWQWLFAINLPLGILAFGISLKYLPANPARAKGKFDFPSAILNAISFATLIFLVDGLGHGSDLWLSASLAVCCLLSGTIFIKRQLRLSSPLLPLDLLSLPVFSLSIATSISAFCAQMMAMIALPFYFQHTLGMTSTQAGLLLSTWPLSIMIAAPVAGNLIGRRFSPAILGSIGMALLAAGLLLLALMPEALSQKAIAVRLGICGVGFGLFQSPNNFVLLSSAPAHRSGGASGLLGTARLLGQTIGASFVAMIYRLSFKNIEQKAMLIAGIIAVIAALVSGMRVANHSVVREANR